MNSSKEIKQIEKKLDISSNDIRKTCNDDDLIMALKYVMIYNDILWDKIAVRLLRCNYAINKGENILFAVKQTLEYQLNK